MEPSDPSPADEVVARLREQVEERRGQGLYPEGLEDALDVHYHHIAVRGVRDRLERLRVALEDADAMGSKIHVDRIPATSERRGGSMVHRAVARLVRRQTEGALTQVREYAEALAEAHRALLLAYVDLVSHVDDLRDRFQDLEARLGRPSPDES